MSWRPSRKDSGDLVFFRRRSSNLFTPELPYLRDLNNKSNFDSKIQIAQDRKNNNILNNFIKQNRAFTLRNNNKVRKKNLDYHRNHPIRMLKNYNEDYLAQPMGPLALAPIPAEVFANTDHHRATSNSQFILNKNRYLPQKSTGTIREQNKKQFESNKIQ